MQGKLLLPVLLVSLGSSGAALAQGSFVNWETPHVHPLDLTPDGVRLVAVNTADGRLEVFDASGPALVPLPPVAVGLDPVSVRARTDTEVWVVNHVGDNVSVVDLATGRVTATLATDDEPCDVVFAGSPQRAFVSCSQANTVLVFDPVDLAAAPARIVLDAEDPRALAVSPSGDRVYVAVFESGNGSTVLGGSSIDGNTFTPNVVDDPAGPYGGVNPPPNDGASFTPAQKAGNPAPPRVSLIVKQDAGGSWMDDNGGDWTNLVSGAQAALSGRVPGWDLPDRDVAVIDTATLGVSWVTRLMNVNMALAVRPTDGFVSVVGTDGTNEIRFEPNLTGTFVRVNLALVDPAGPKSVLDLNPHLTYATSNVPQAQRDQSLGDPRGIAWSAAGTRAYVTGMGSNNVVVIDAAGARAGLSPTIDVGEGPTGIVLDEAADRAFVLDKFEAAVSVVDLSAESETARVPFFDPSPAAIRIGRKHLYDTHANSGLGQIACASCHVDARMDRLAWDLGDPSGDVKSVAGQNLAAGLGALGGTFEDWHPMKGPMLTQTMQDIIGKEPHHWRGDRNGLEEFAGAFVGLQGDDAPLGQTAMQEFEDFLATIHFPPNPYRDLQNGLPTDLDLEGHYTTGRFGPAGQPLPNGDATRGLALYRPPNLLDGGGLACVTCHTLPTGLGTDTFLNPFTYTPFPVGPNGEHHHALVAIDGLTNISMKIPQLRNLYERTGFNLMQASSRAGFGLIHDGSVDAIETFVSEPIFNVQSDQDVADLTAFMLAFSGSDLPEGSTTGLFEPPGTPSQDTHAAVGTQTTLVSLAGAPAAQLTLIGDLIALADGNAVGLVARGRVADEARGWTYEGGGTWQSDRLLEAPSTGALQALAAPGSELTFVVVPKGTETRIGIDRDEDGAFDRDELDAGFDPADAASAPGSCGAGVPSAPTGLVATGVGTSLVQLSWTDTSAQETAFAVERALAGSGSFVEVALLPADTSQVTDVGLDCSEAYDYRVIARSCAGSSAAATAVGIPQACELLRADLPRISLALGGTQTFQLEAGAANAGQLYWVLGSATGTSPGLPAPPFTVPLNFDNYFLFTLQHPNVLIANSLNVLDGTGASTASIALAPGLDPGLAGAVLNHAYLVFDTGTLALVMVSNAVSLTLAP